MPVADSAGSIEGQDKKRYTKTHSKQESKNQFLETWTQWETKGKKQ